MNGAIYAPDLDVRFRLERLLTKHVHERAELLAAKVPAHRVEALYPLDFDRMVRLAGERFATRGTAHLNPAVLPSEQWAEATSLFDRLQRDMEPESNSAYWREWHAHYGPDEAKLKFYQLTNAGLRYHYNGAGANFTRRAGHVLFISYWLLRHPQLLAAQEDRAQQLMEWAATKLLCLGR